MHKHTAGQDEVFQRRAVYQLSVGRMSASLTTGLLYVFVAVRTVATLTCSSLQGCTVVILPSGSETFLSQHDHVTNLKGMCHLENLHRLEK